MSNIDVQKGLIKWGYLDPPADGQWGAQSGAALRYFQKVQSLSITGEPDTATIAALQAAPIPLKLGNDLASRVVREMLKNNYWVSRGEKSYNIVYIEGADKDGTPNADEFNVWNDRRLVIGAIRLV